MHLHHCPGNVPPYASLILFIILFIITEHPTILPGKSREPGESSEPGDFLKLRSDVINRDLDVKLLPVTSI